MRTEASLCLLAIRRTLRPVCPIAGVGASATRLVTRTNRPTPIASGRANRDTMKQDSREGDTAGHEGGSFLLHVFRRGAAHHLYIRLRMLIHTRAGGLNAQR